MPQRNRSVQREARKLRDRQQDIGYTEARADARNGLQVSRLHPGPAMLDAGVWSRYGRWIFNTDDWQQWRFRAGCGHEQSPADVAVDGTGARPELAITQCLQHGPDADPAVCPPAGTRTRGAKFYTVIWWHGGTPVFPFAYDKEYIVRGPLTEADDVHVIVPGITRPLATRLPQ